MISRISKRNRRAWGVLATVLCAGSALLSAAEFPEARISNGQITAKIYLPDAKNGYYRSTRFEWSGAVHSLRYKGHEFYGPWYDRIDPAVINWVHEGSEIVAGPCSALWGPVNEFETPLGFNEAKAGGAFIKIGVGVLRRAAEGRYNRYQPYEVLDPGKWTVKQSADSIEFTQELSDPASGYGYVYRKTVRLVSGKPEMEIAHSLKNTGKLAIHSNVYNHNFMVIDKQGPGPDTTFRVPYQIQSTRPPNIEMAEVRGNEVVYARPLAGKDEVSVFLQGLGSEAKDSEVVIENRRVGSGVKISTDRPLIRSLLWSIRTVLAVEPYIAVNVEPGAEFTWKNTLDYYTIPVGKAESAQISSKRGGSQ
jgi:hypothetical protein